MKHIVMSSDARHNIWACSLKKTDHDYHSKCTKKHHRSVQYCRIVIHFTCYQVDTYFCLLKQKDLIHHKYERVIVIAFIFELNTTWTNTKCIKFIGKCQNLSCMSKGKVSNIWPIFSELDRCECGLT